MLNLIDILFDHPDFVVVNKPSNISVQNELVAAYNDLRDREFRRLYPSAGLTFVEANKKYSDPRTTPDQKMSLKPKLDVVKGMFPQKLSEAEPSKN